MLHDFQERVDDAKNCAKLSALNVREGEKEGRKEGGDLIIYRKKAVPHLSVSPASLGTAPLRRGSLAPRTRTFSSRSTRTDGMLHSEEAEGKERPFPSVLLLTAANSPLSAFF